MRSQSNILDQISPLYFWDMSFSKLDMIANRRIIIERIFSLGKVDEMIALLHYYGKKNVIETLTQINYLDPKTLNFVSKLFDIPQSNFKCYTHKPLTHPHWNS